MPNRIVTDGLKQLARQARTFDDKTIIRGLKTAHADAADIVVRRGLSIARSTGRRATEKAAESMRVTKTAAYAAVKLGSKSEPWLIAENFGALHDKDRITKTGRKVRGWNQFPKVFEKEFLYKAIDESIPDISAAYAVALQDLLNKDFT